MMLFVCELHIYNCGSLHILFSKTIVVGQEIWYFKLTMNVVEDVFKVEIVSGWTI